jgi:hypothetical protein
MSDFDVETDPALARAWGRLAEPMRPLHHDTLATTTTVALGLWERLRVLFGASVRVKTQTPVTFVERLGVRFGQTTSSFELKP